VESSLELRYGSSSVEDGTRRENPEGIPGGRNMLHCSAYLYCKSLIVKSPSTVIMTGM
jgi:hypothetical protein